MYSAKHFALFFTAACLFAQAPAPAPAKPPAPKPTAPAAAAPAAAPPDKVILTIGDEKMTVAEFDEFIDALPEQYKAMARGAGKRQLAEQLVRVKLLAQEARRRKIDQRPGFKRQVALQTENMLAGALAHAMESEVKPDDATLHRYYDEHKNEFEQVQARHILVRMKGSPAPLPAGKKELTEEEALAKAQELRKKITGGEDFAAVAKAESDDSGSGKNGGELGTFRRGQMTPLFEQAAFAANVGDVTEPVKTPFGYHLIQVEKKTVKSFEETRPDLEKRLKPEQARQAIEEIRKKADVKIDDAFFGPAPAPAR
jgi:peptidyl-prolyl cis-trans isomerase C